jgi:hypothetical protein
MSFAAQEVIQRAAFALQDETGVRWDALELVRHLNDGQRQLLADRPDAFAAKTAHTLVAGVRQTLPSTAAKFMDILSNTNGAPCRQVDRVGLDATRPGWRGEAGVAAPRNWMHDPRDPLVFEVYPPALVTSSVQLIYAVDPTMVAEPAPGSDYADVTGTVGLNQVFFNPLIDWVLYRAFSKDGEHPANAARAAAHFAAYRQALGLEAQATDAVMPRPGRPGQPSQ